MIGPLSRECERGESGRGTRTDDGAPGGLSGGCGHGGHRVGWGDQSEGGLAVVVVVVVVHNAQVHGEDGCGCSGHLHGQRCRADVHCRREKEK